MDQSSPLRRHLTGFRLHCVAENRSPRTVEWYEHKLRIFTDFLEARYDIGDPAAVQADHVRAFLVHMREEVHPGDLNPHRTPEDGLLSPLTVQGYYRAIKAFFSWLVLEDYLPDSPMRKIKQPKAPQVLVAAFDEDQIRRLLAAPDKSTPIGFRDYCILLLFFDTGVRLGELVRLGIPDLRLEAGLMQVRGKGDKERIVPVGSKACKALWRYISHLRPAPVPEDAQNVFLSKNGRPMTGEAVYWMIVRRGKEAGITGVRCSPHTFRHTFAITFLRNGGGVFALQRILGHTSLVVTRMYCGLSESDMQTQHRRCSPGDHLG